MVRFFLEANLRQDLRGVKTDILEEATHYILPARPGTMISRTEQHEWVRRHMSSDRGPKKFAVSRDWIHHMWYRADWIDPSPYTVNLWGEVEPLPIGSEVETLPETSVQRIERRRLSGGDK